MDSVTQAALGAAIGEAVLGRRHGHKAAAWGALCATLPDLDTFYPYAGAVEAFTWHRGYSHSFLVLMLSTPLLTWLILRIHPRAASDAVRWGTMVLLVLITHALLDCMTVYGTQVWLPFSDYPVAVSAIFIIDPLYTLPLLVGVLCALLMHRSRNTGRRVNAGGLVLSSLYLCLALATKAHVNDTTERALANQGMAGANYLSTPTPFNVLLWRIVAMEDGGYREGFYSLFDGDAGIVFYRGTSDNHLLDDAAGTGGGEKDGGLERLKWFSRGFYKVWSNDKAVIFSDLRMGMLETFVFNFALAKITGGATTPLKATPVPQPPTPDGFFHWLLRRIIDRNAALPALPLPPP